MSLFPISPVKEKALQEKMASLNILEEDLEESFVRSGGKGGQHVNKTSTCVHLRHGPTGIEVKCQQERSQAMNRYRARVILAEKIEELIRGEESAARQRIEKIRRQKRRRSKKAKEKILADKKQQSEKKTRRSPVSTDEA